MFKNHDHYPYFSKRHVTYGKNGMVATSQTQAADCGLDILKKGGNAIDAAIATAAALTILEPTRNGLGGDAFALFWYQGKLYGLNASGKSPETISIDKLKAKGHKEMPKFGAEAITTPGVIGGWVALSEKFGRLPFEDLLAPAIKLANTGFVVTPMVASNWKTALKTYKENLNKECFDSFEATFSLDKKAPKSGDIFQLKDHANTLQAIAKSKGEAFYKGRLGDQMVAFVQKQGGFLSKNDLANYTPEFVEPISSHYKGYDIWELPPNNQGLITLEALKIYENQPYDALNVNAIHQQIEAMKLAFKDGLKYISDPKHMSISHKDLLHPDYIKKRREAIAEDAQDFKAGAPKKGGTVYLATADKAGNMVSFIQSNYMGFGSGVVIPNTGIAMQNRGHTFSLDEHHINALKPGKRTYHTIIPGFISQNQHPLGPFGVMGGYMQPQGHMQVAINLIDEQLNPQSALDKWRWQWMKEKTVMVEKHTPSAIIDGLVQRGHHVIISASETPFGVGQIILRNPHNHVYVGACDKRADSAVLGY